MLYRTLSWVMPPTFRCLSVNSEISDFRIRHRPYAGDFRTICRTTGDSEIGDFRIWSAVTVVYYADAKDALLKALSE